MAATKRGPKAARRNPRPPAKAKPKATARSAAAKGKPARPKGKPAPRPKPAKKAPKKPTPKAKPAAKAKPAVKPKPKVAAPKAAPAKAAPAKAAPAKAAPAKAAPAKAVPPKAPPKAPAPTPPPPKAPAGKAPPPPSPPAAPTKAAAPAKPPGAPAAGAAKPASAPARPGGPARPAASPLPVPSPPALKPARVEAPAPIGDRPTHVHRDILSAVAYGLFAAINRSFGYQGKGLVQHASRRFLEFGAKKGWLPHSKDPLKGLKEFFDTLVRLGYAERVSWRKEGETIVCEVRNSADWEAVEYIRSLGYRLTPEMTGQLIVDLLEQEYRMLAVMEESKLMPDRAGAEFHFTMAPKPEVVSTVEIAHDRVPLYDDET